MKAFICVKAVWGGELFVFLFYDCFCCTDTCQNILITLNHFLEDTNDLHISLKTEETLVERLSSVTATILEITGVDRFMFSLSWPHPTANQHSELFMLYLNMMLALHRRCIVPFFSSLTRLKDVSLLLTCRETNLHLWVMLENTSYSSRFPDILKSPACHFKV